MAVPKLRFGADDGSEFPEWEEKKFGDVFENMNNNTYSRECLNYSVGVVKNIHYGDILMKFGACVDVGNEDIPYINEGLNFEKYNKLENGDIVIADTAEDDTVGKAVEIQNNNHLDVVAGLHTIACRPKYEFAARYLGYYLNSDAYHFQLRPYMQGIKVTSISKTNIQLTTIQIPSLPEQRKIAEFLSMIDEIIQSTESELTAWQERKKGVMQKIFNREVRFKADDGSEFPEWEEKTFSEILSENKIPIPKPTNGYERLGIRSHGKGTFHEYVPAGEGLDVDTMYVVEAHNLILNITFAWEQAIAITDNEDDGKLVSHRFPQYKFNDGFDWHYFKYDILDKKLKHELGLASPGGAGRNRVLNKSDFLRIKRVVPCLDEQKKIADCLSSLDDVISNIQAELSAWKEFKKGLLQQMFV